MSPTMISTVVVSFFLVCIIIGFIFGWVRGFSRSLTRFLIVLGVTVLAFFVVPFITNAILNMDISKWNVVVGEGENAEVARTLGEYLTSLLTQIPYVGELMEVSDTLAAIITLVPMMLVNVILFVLFFFLFKWVSMIIYWIIWGVCFNKKKMKDKDRHKFIGAVIGVFQGLLVALVIMVPVFGMIETARPVMAAFKEEQQAETPEGQTALDKGTYTVTEETTGSEGTGDAATDNTNNTANEPIIPQEVITETEKYFNAFDNTWIIKVLDKIKIKALNVKMFDHLTTVSTKVDSGKLEVGLRSEVTTFAGAYKEAKPVIDNFDIEKGETYDTLHATFDKLYKSPIISGVLSEAIPNIATIWSTPDGTFLGMTRPTFEDKSVDNLFVVLLDNLKLSDKDSVKADLLTSIDVMGVCGRSGLLSAALGKSDEDIMDVLIKPENDTLVADIIDVALGSGTLKAILPDLINVAMEKVYVSLGITNPPASVPPETINWDTEKVCLQNVFTNVVNVYVDYDNGTKNNPHAAPIEFLNFRTLGLAFDYIRSSQLLGSNSYEILKSIANSDIMAGGADGFVASFIEKLGEVWNDPTVSLADTFESLKETIDLAKKISEANGNFTAEEVGEVIKGLASNKLLNGTVEDIISDPKNLEQFGLDSTVAGVVSETVHSVFAEVGKIDDEAFGKEVDAVVSVFETAQKVLTVEEGKKASIEETEAKKIVDNIAASDTIKNVLIGETSNSAVKDLNIGANLEDPAKANLTSAIEGSTLTTAEQARLKALFGLTNA